MTNALDLLDATIAELEARLNLRPGEAPRGLDSEEFAASGAVSSTSTAPAATKQQQGKKSKKAAAITNSNATSDASTKDPSKSEDQPEICKLEFKVGVVTKVWVHETADKLYCEEIDVGEEAPRQIASGLRPHFTLEQMLGQRLLVVSNLKAKNLVGFKSHGMVLCAAATNEDGSERVEFVEPPPEAAIGEMVIFEGLPHPKPLSPAQVEKKKVFQACLDGLRTTEERVAEWNGHAFMTTAGPCKTKTIAGGCLR